MPATTGALAARLGLALALGLPPSALLPPGPTRRAYVGLWSGVCFAAGLALGGMVRPSVVMGALSPAAFDGTLWVLFMTALGTTFAFYRLAGALGKSESRAASKSGIIDAKLLLGALLFGVGWGSSGLCPGPHIVGLGANPTAQGPLLMLSTVSLGMLSSKAIAPLLA
jgi:uncharacterized membrane protein YedE/YeeE